MQATPPDPVPPVSQSDLRRPRATSETLSRGLYPLKAPFNRSLNQAGWQGQLALGSRWELARMGLGISFSLYYPQTLTENFRVRPPRSDTWPTAAGAHWRGPRGIRRAPPACRWLLATPGERQPGRWRAPRDLFLVTPRNNLIFSAEQRAVEKTAVGDP